MERSKLIFMHTKVCRFNNDNHQVMRPRQLEVLIKLTIIIRQKKKKRAPLGGLCFRKMLAFCCQRQFFSTVDNMRQYGNTGQWIVADVTKPHVSKKNQQQTNLRPFWTWALTDNPWWKEPHQESHKLKVLLHIYWELMQHLGGLTAFIVSAVRRVGYWSVKCIEGGGSGLSLWIINCCASAFVSKMKAEPHSCRVRNRN